jgi:hypothetical protein
VVLSSSQNIPVTLMPFGEVLDSISETMSGSMLFADPDQFFLQS